MYNESRVDFPLFGDDRKMANLLIEYEPMGVFSVLKLNLEISEDDARRQWKQLLYFFATLFVFQRMRSPIPTTGKGAMLQPPPLLEAAWRVVCQSMPDVGIEFCRLFFDSRDLRWKEDYPPRHRLTPDGLKTLLELTKSIEFEIDEMLWALEPG